MTEIETLKQLLKEDWHELSYSGEIDGFRFVEDIEGDDRRWSRTVEVITRGPSGKHYRWQYEHGLTEYQDSEGPGEYGEPEVTPVWPVTKTIEVTEWEAE